MTSAVALVCVALFVVAFRVAHILPRASHAISRVRSAASVLADGSKTDDEKERVAREASLALFGSFLTITLLTALALVPSLLCVYIASWTGIAKVPDLMNAFVSVPLIIAAVLFFAVERMILR
jgi:hypothetical protein